MSIVTQQVLEAAFFHEKPPQRIITQLTELVHPESVAAGTVIFSEGSEENRLRFVELGQIDLEINVPGRGDVRLLSLGPGDILGWSAVLGSGKMTTSAIARQNSKLLVLQQTDLQAACEGDPEFGYHVMKNLARGIFRRLQATRLQLIDLFGESSIPDHR